VVVVVVVAFAAAPWATKGALVQAFHGALANLVLAMWEMRLELPWLP
jgi:hypothetical protein